MMHDRAYLPPQTRRYVRKLLALALAYEGSELLDLHDLIPRDEWDELIREGYVEAPGELTTNERVASALKGALQAIT